MCTPMPPSAGGSLPAMDPYGKVVTAMRRPALILAGAAAVAANRPRLLGAVSRQRR